jgi:hypothetical protein
MPALSYVHPPAEPARRPLAEKRSTKTLRQKPSVPLLLRKAASTSALRPIVSTAQSSIGSNGAAHVIDAPLARRRAKAGAAPPVPILPDEYTTAADKVESEDGSCYPPMSTGGVIVLEASSAKQPDEEKRGWYAKLGFSSTVPATTRATTAGTTAVALPRGAATKLRKLLGAKAPAAVSQGPPPSIVLQLDEASGAED